MLKMPPLLAPNSPKSEGVGKIASFTTFAQSLLRRLPSAIDPPSIDSLLADLKDPLNAIMGFAAGAPRAKRERNELDRRGTELWNLCTRLRRDDVPSGAAPPTRKRVLLLRCRVFAFFMIDVARGGGGKLLADVVHLMRLALKAGRMCIDDNSTKLAGSIFVKGSNYSNILNELQKTMLGPDDLAECRRLDAEYYILRTALCWKENQLEVAEFMYSKGQPTLRSLDPSSAEKMAEVLFEIGKDLSKNKDFTLAARWLERAHDVINGQDLDLLHRDAVELRLSISQGLIHALLGTKTQESLHKAHELVNHLASEVGERPIVLLLRLELLQQAPAEVFDVEEYAEILRRMVRSFNFSEAHFKLLMHHAGKLHSRSPSLASNVVDGMLGGTVVSSGRDEWAERLVLLRIWMETKQRDSMQAVEDLEAVLMRLQDNLTQPFGASAAVGAITLIWKKVEVNYNSADFDIADGWCRLALQPLFVNGGPGNISRLGRKLILCAMGRNDVDRARQVFYEMPEAAQNEPMTRYLMYKVALRSADRELAADCLERVGVAAAQDPNFLYACVLEAQKAGDKVCAMQAMKQLVGKHEFNESSPIHLPALLRCNIRLAIQVMADEKGSAEKTEAVEEIVLLFEAAAKAIQRDPKDQDGNRLFTVKELDWFCQNSYNLGLKSSDSWDLTHLVRLFNSCLDVAKQYPADLPAEAASDLAFRTMFCNFVVAAALVSLARAEDNTERQLQHYLVLRRHVEAYDSLLQARVSGGLDKRLTSDLNAKSATLLVFDFEAAMALKKYDDLGYIIRLARKCRDVDALKAMGDMVLRGKLPGQEMFTALGGIVNEIWELEQMKGDRLAKYIRCMFHAVQPLNPSLGQRLMSQAIQIARDSAKGPHPFPSDELEWLATVSFNQAVDAYNARRDDECNRWADLAMNLAHYAADDGVLERTLQENRMKLNFELS